MKMKIVKVKVGDGHFDRDFITDVEDFCSAVKRGVGYIIEDDIMRQFHNFTNDKWRFELIDQKKMRQRVFAIVRRKLKTFNSYQEAKEEGYED